MTLARRRQWLLALLLVAVATIGLAAPAGAHAELITSSPADGTTVPTAPAELRLEFSESVTVTLGGVRVFDGGGQRVDLGNAQRTADGAVVTVGLAEDLADGSYVVSWRAVSADSHPIHGGFLFSVGSESQIDAGLTESLTQGGSDKGWQIAAAVLRIAAYLGVLLAAGVTALVSFVGTDEDRRRLRPLAVAAAAVGALAIILGLPVQATLASGLGFGAILEPGVFDQVAGDGVGLSILLGLVGLAALVAASFRPAGPNSLPASLIAAPVAVGSFALAGHTRVTDPAWLVTLVDLVHLWAAAVWFGGLVVLVAVLRRTRKSGDPTAAAGAVARFSGIATLAIVAVSLAGFALGWFEVQTLEGLTSTTYGRVLMAKLAAVAVVAAIGAYNRFRLVPGVEAAGADSARWHLLGRTVLSEVVGIVVVLGLTGVLVGVTPARSAVRGGEIVSVSEQLGAGTINLTVDPNQAGINTIHIYLLDELGRQSDLADTLTLEFTQEAMGIGPIERSTFKAGPGHWQYDGDALSLPGEWRITAVARVSRFDEERANMTVEVG